MSAKVGLAAASALAAARAFNFSQASTCSNSGLSQRLACGRLPLLLLAQAHCGDWIAARALSSVRCLKAHDGKSAP